MRPLYVCLVPVPPQALLARPVTLPTSPLCESRTRFFAKIAAFCPESRSSSQGRGSTRERPGSRRAMRRAARRAPHPLFLQIFPHFHLTSSGLRFVSPFPGPKGLSARPGAAFWGPPGASPALPPLVRRLRSRARRGQRAAP